MTKKLLYQFIATKNIQFLHKDINWYNFLALLVSEKLEGYFFKIISENTIIEKIPKQVRKILYISYKYNQVKNEIYLKEFENIRQKLLENDVQVFSYKGLFLITDIYKDYGVRYMEDIDILSSETDYNVIRCLLKDYNYQLLSINDSDITCHTFDEIIYSCLFVKRNSEKEIVPFVKLDISPISIVFNDIEISKYFNSTNLLPEYIFVLLCKSFYDDACEKSKVPSPEDGTLIKLIDIIL